jgi:hypothetical protein
MTSQQADNSLATKQLEGRKQNKERLTLAVCCNADGSDKLPLLVIGKYENPRCFKNVNRDSFGCKYRSNPKAWMTQVIFLEWLKGFDARMAGRNVLLIMDNCSAHIPLMQLASVVTLRNTTVFYLPPNTTSKIQPCDVGIIRSLKAYYRRRFNRLLIQRLQDKVADPEKIDVLEAMHIAVAAWSMDVKPETIRNCFRHCRIHTTDADVTPVPEEPLIDPEVIKDLEEQVQELRYQNPMDIRNLIDYPAELEVAYVPTQEEIVQDLSTNPVPEDEVEVDDSQESIPVKATEALQCASLLQQFWMQQDIVDHEMLAGIQTVKDKISIMRSSKLVQKPISEYFSKV